MVYYAQGMELEVVSTLFRGEANDVDVCRDRRSASGTLYTLLVVHDRACARNMMTVREQDRRSGEDPPRTRICFSSTPIGRSGSCPCSLRGR